MSAVKPPVITYALANYPLLYEFLGQRAASMLKRKAQKCNSVEQYINLAYTAFDPYTPLGWTISPQQVKREIATLLSIVSKRNIHSMLEIGTMNGGTLFLFSRVIASNAKMISLDLPSDEARKRGYDRFKSAFFENFIKKDQQLKVLRADSHNENSLKKIVGITKSEPLDFLFIDGDHLYSGVRKDFEMYSPLVRKGGLIAFHDIYGHNPGVSEVDQLWAELKESYAHSEICENPNQGWAGIGLLFV